MDINNTDHLYEALYRAGAPHGTVMETQRQDENHIFNYLDAATPAWLAENADKIILAFARKMAIRCSGRQEDEFIRNGYSGDGPVARGIIPEAVILEAEKHVAFYQKTKARVGKLAHLDSINRRSQMTVLRFPAKESRYQQEQADANKKEADKARDLVDVYELMRRSHIAGNASGTDSGPSDYYRDWLDDATQEELAEATDTILFCGAARTAILMSIRLDKAWHQPLWVNNEWPRHKTELLSDVRKERDHAVDSYLKFREAQAKFEHNQGIVARSESDTRISKPRRPHAKRKVIKLA